LALSLRDLSSAGVGHQSVSLQQGERLAVFFPKKGELREWDAYGRVIRCELEQLRLSRPVEFDPLPHGCLDQRLLSSAARP